jgi:hypothetical protein
MSKPNLKRTKDNILENLAADKGFTFSFSIRNQPIKPAKFEQNFGS